MCATFLTIFTRLEPTAIGGELWFACEGTCVSMGGRARSSVSFLQDGPRSPTCVYKFFSGLLRSVLDRKPTVILRVGAVKK